MFTNLSYSTAFAGKSNTLFRSFQKKKGLIGNFKNNGKEYAPRETPTEVNAHDFISEALRKAIPYGIYDIVRNEDWVNVGISSDSTAKAVVSKRA